MQIGDRVLIEDNLEEVMKDLGFDDCVAERAASLYPGQIFTAHDIWEDDDGEKFVTIDLCVEIPVQCCTVVA